MISAIYQALNCRVRARSKRRAAALQVALALRYVVTLTLVAGTIVGAQAQTFPSRPITIIVPTTAGGPPDTIARLLSDRMKAVLGQPIIVENVTGAGSTLGLARVARAAPDGYTGRIGH